MRWAGSVVLGSSASRRRPRSAASSPAGGALVDYWRGAMARRLPYGRPSGPAGARRSPRRHARHALYGRRARPKDYVNPLHAGHHRAQSGRSRFRSFDPAVSPEYAFTGTINGYAKYSTGYRAGGFSTQSTPAISGPVNEENVKAWEVGLVRPARARRASMRPPRKYSDPQATRPARRRSSSIRSTRAVRR